jgi:hypothetical protein
MLGQIDDTWAARATACPAPKFARYCSAWRMLWTGHRSMGFTLYRHSAHRDPRCIVWVMMINAFYLISHGVVEGSDAVRSVRYRSSLRCSSS